MSSKIDTDYIPYTPKKLSTIKEYYHVILVKLYDVVIDKLQYLSNKLIEFCMVRRTEHYNRLLSSVCLNYLHWGHVFDARENAEKKISEYLGDKKELTMYDVIEQCSED